MNFASRRSCNLLAVCKLHSGGEAIAHGYRLGGRALFTRGGAFVVRCSWSVVSCFVVM